MFQAKNNAQLESILAPKIKEAVNYFVQKIWNENRELVRILVYESYTPSVYNRTGEFKEAWETDAKLITNNKIQGSFYFAPDKLTPGDNDPESPRYGQHVSAIDRYLMTTYLADVIYQGLSGPAFGHGVESGVWHEKRDVWTRLEKELGAAKLKQWMKESFDKVGLPVKSHGKAWSITKW